MEFTQYQNKKIFFQTSGSGVPLVLIHGFCEDLKVWDELMPGLGEIPTLRIDLPGFGQSEAVENPSVEYYAAAVKTVLDFLKIEKCVMVGHSMGGYTTLSFAEFYPEHLQGFGLFHSHPFPDSPESQHNRQKSIQFIQKNGPIYYVKQLIPKLFPPAFITSNRYLIDRMVFKASKYAAEGVIGGLVAMKNRPDRQAILRSSTVPVLFILGEKDDLIPFEKQLEQTHLPGISSVHILPRVGHMGMLEKPKKTGEVLRNFYQFCTE